MAVVGRYKKYGMKSIYRMTFVLLFLWLAAGCKLNKESGRELFEAGLQEMAEGNLPVAYRQFLRAASLFDESGDSIGSFEAKSHLGLLCSMIGQKEEGYEFIKSVPYFHVKLEGNYSSQYYWRMKAYYAFVLDRDYQGAAFCIRKLLELDSLDYPDIPGYLYMDKANLAEMYLMTGQDGKARKIIEHLEANPLDDDIYLSQTYYIHALLLAKQGLMDSACVLAGRSMKYSAMYDAPENAANALKIMMAKDSMAGDMASYIDRRDSYDSVMNRMRGGEISRHIAVIKEQNKFDLALRETQRQHREKNLWLGGLLVAIAATSVIIFLLYKQNRLKLKSETAERMRLDQEIEYKKLENELLALKMAQTQDELAKQRMDNADAIRSLASVDDRKETKTRLEMLEITLNTEHASFIRYIEKPFPQLTHNDVLILGFMRMGMNPQEIASVLGISVDSFQKARYRLRKKLSIDTMAALDDFVSGYSET